MKKSIELLHGIGLLLLIAILIVMGSYLESLIGKGGL
jgi:hypothetical protein